MKRPIILLVLLVGGAIFTLAALLLLPRQDASLTVPEEEPAGRHTTQRSEPVELPPLPLLKNLKPEDKPVSSENIDATREALEQIAKKEDLETARLLFQKAMDLLRKDGSPDNTDPLVRKFGLPYYMWRIWGKYLEVIETEVAYIANLSEIRMQKLAYLFHEDHLLNERQRFLKVFDEELRRSYYLLLDYVQAYPRLPDIYKDVDGVLLLYEVRKNLGKLKEERVKNLIWIARDAEEIMKFTDEKEKDEWHKKYMDLISSFQWDDRKTNEKVK